MTTLVRRVPVLALLVLFLGPVASQERSLPYTAKVVEVARTVDLERGGKEWLAVTVQVAAPGEPGVLRHVQPLREHFRLAADGDAALDCAWLKGGTSVEDPRVLRFQAGFPLPAANVRKVHLTMLLPRPRPAETATFHYSAAALAKLPATATAAQGSIAVTHLEEEAYTPPPLPPDGRTTMKGITIDSRLFRRPERAGEKPPERALRVSWNTRALDLFDRLLELDAGAEGSVGRRCALLSARVERWPARGIEAPGFEPRVFGHYWFVPPGKESLRALTLSFTLRAPEKEHLPVDLGDLPVPGR